MASDKNGKVSEKVKGNDKIKPEDKLKALETALTQIKKQFGEGAVMRLGQNNTLQVESIPTGSLSLDLALGIGGLPRGRIVEIYGPESSGKTTLALHCVAEGQKMGGNAAFIDVEHALDPVYASALGVDVDSLLVSQPDTGEQALEITEALVRSNAIDLADVLLAVELDALELVHEVQVLLDRHVEIKRRHFRQVADQLLDLVRVFERVFALNRYRTARSGKVARNDIHGRRFAGAVRPKEADDRALFNREADLVQRDVCTVALGEVFDLDHDC